MRTKFEWSLAKAESNLRKHRVSFETARLVFSDPFAIVDQDRIENGELRRQTLGVVDGYLLLLVAHTEREDEDGTEVIRIISARRAESKERKRYERNYSSMRG
jgi:uncharacterized DUF497 family protein